MAGVARKVRPYSRGSMNAIGIDATPSLLWNNLSTNGDRTAYVHKSRVLLFNEAASEGKVDTDTISIKDLSGVTQAKWVKAGRADQLVVCTSAGVNVYDVKVEGGDARANLLYADSLCHRMEAPSGCAKFCRGAAGIGSSGKVAVGTFTGEIAIYDNGDLQHALLAGHKAAICCIESSRDFWVSSDDVGTVIVWSNSGEIVCKYAGNGFPCTSVVTRGKDVVAGYASGHVRFFKIGVDAPQVEVAAHARAVTGLAIHPSLPLVASAGEDTVLSVFNIPSGKEDVEAVFTTTVTDRLLTGVQFSQRDESSSDVMVAAYDSHSVSVWMSS